MNDERAREDITAPFGENKKNPYKNRVLKIKTLNPITFENKIVFFPSLWLRDWVVVKEDDKILCHEKGVYIKTMGNHLEGNV